METQFDDSLLATSENLANVDYDRLESFGTVSEGRKLVVIEEVKGYLHNFRDYTGPRAKLKMRVMDSQDKSDVNRYVYDDLNLPHPQEKDGNQSRRVLIGVRLGLIPRGAHAALGIDWKQLQGRQAVITVVHQKSDKGKTYANVTFDGYEGPEAWTPAGHAAGSLPAAETWSDI